MADMCPVCKSGDTQGGLDRSMCLNCGSFFNVNDKGETVQVQATSGETQPNGDGPVAEVVDVLEPETKGGRGLAVASQPSSTESALVQEGAVPQHGLLPSEAEHGQETAFDAPDGFTAPVAYNERLDPLAKPLAKATSREDEVAVSEKAEGVEPTIVLKNTENNADSLGSPVADKAVDPVDDDTKKTGADKDRTFVSAQELTDSDTPTDAPDSLPAQKTAEQKATGEVVTPDPAPEPSAPDRLSGGEPAPVNPDSDAPEEA